MSDNATRNNFLTSLEEITEIAKATNHEAAQAVLLILMAAMRTGDEMALLEHCVPFAQRHRDECLAAIAKGRQIIRFARVVLKTPQEPLIAKTASRSLASTLTQGKRNVIVLAHVDSWQNWAATPVGTVTDRITLIRRLTMIATPDR